LERRRRRPDPAAAGPTPPTLMQSSSSGIGPELLLLGAPPPVDAPARATIGAGEAPRPAAAELSPSLPRACASLPDADAAAGG
jgi:hypothetical protein